MGSRTTCNEEHHGVCSVPEPTLRGGLAKEAQA